MTPAMQQFREVKSQYPDHLVLFRMGDFYETFYDDAQKASQILGITLTARDKERKVPMAGIPFHALDTYLGKLIDENQKVVIVEQLEDPKEAVGVVKRGVVKIVTPGTSTLEKDLKKNNFLSAISIQENIFCFAFIDLIEGIIYESTFDTVKDLENNILVVAPREILVSKKNDLHKIFSKEFLQQVHFTINQIEPSYFTKISDPNYIKPELLVEVEKLNSGDIIALLNYLIDTQRTQLFHVSTLKKLSILSSIHLDSTAIQNLELLSGTRKNSTSLFSIIDKCATNNGSKKLKTWLVRPLIDKIQIHDRLASVESCKNLGLDTISNLKRFLSQIHDLSRIACKIGLSSANARDLRNLIESIKQIVPFSRQLKSLNLSNKIQQKILELESEIKNASSTLTEIDKVIDDNPPLSIREGKMIRPGINADLDHLYSLKSNSSTWLTEFEQGEIKRTKISTLKVRYNKVFGYYIEISKSHIDKVPSEYIRKQTLVNGERFITPELKEQETNILTADEKIRKLEFDIFTQVLDKSKAIISNIQAINEVLSELDIYLALAECALLYNWVKPEVTTNDTINIKNGRHPVVEYILEKEGKGFIKNDVCLDSSKSLQIITGPNMGGKSTFIRQTALIVLLAQIGSFIPADKAEIGIVDRIFTRIGASDNLSMGESTFMVEMLEAAEILHNASKKSLIILDEIGRGTSTFDGMSIAWAICEFIQKLGARTLFATHYHELTELANKYSNVKNLSVKVYEHNKEIVFLHQIVPGRADKSYGIHVAKLAGIPVKVLTTAQQILSILEKERNKLQPRPQELFTLEENHNVVTETTSDHIFDELKRLDVNALSPLQALQKLTEWKEELESEE